MSMIKIKEYHKKLVDGVKQVLESKNFSELLRFSSRFHKYSFGNTILIWVQRPHATRVAGIKTWNSLERHVKKGETGIAIFAPIVKKVKGQSMETDNEVEKESEKERLIGFRAVYVWDVEQTKGTPLPELKTEKPIMNGDPDKLFKQIFEASPVPVEYEDIQGKAKGYYMPKEKKIVLSTKLTPEEKAKTLLHELAHHLTLTDTEEGEIEKQDRPTGEVIAEGVAFVTSAHFGLDSSGYSFPYVATWSKDTEQVLSAGQTIRKVAHQLIEMIENETMFVPAVNA